jgi:hypothetical protein
LWWLGLPAWAGGGIANDLTRQWDGTLTGMAPASDWVPTELGCYALYLDGGNEYVDFGDVRTDLSDSASLTVAAWINVPNVTGRKMVGSKWDAGGNNRCWMFELNGAALRCFVSSDGTYNAAYTATGGTASANTWHHVVFQHDVSGLELRLFLDGVEVASNTASVPNSRDNNAIPVWMGAEYASPPVQDFTGYVADFRMWPRFLSADGLWNVYEDSRRGWPESLRRVRRCLAKPAAAFGGVSQIIGGGVMAA